MKDGVRCYMTKEGALVCEKLEPGNYRWSTALSYLQIWYQMSNLATAHSSFVLLSRILTCCHLFIRCLIDGLSAAQTRSCSAYAAWRE